MKTTSVWILAAAVLCGCGRSLGQAADDRREREGGWIIDYGQLEYLDKDGVWHLGARVMVDPCGPSAVADEAGFCLRIETPDGRLDRVRGIRPTSPRLVGWAQFSGKPMLVWNDERARWERP